jgi:hypothetical protein
LHQDSSYWITDAAFSTSFASLQACFDYADASNSVVAAALSDVGLHVCCYCSAGGRDQIIRRPSGLPFALRARNRSILAGLSCASRATFCGRALFVCCSLMGRTKHNKQVSNPEFVTADPTKYTFKPQT